MPKTAETSKGVRLEKLIEFLGHNGFSTTSRRYRQLADEGKVPAVVRGYVVNPLEALARWMAYQQDRMDSPEEADWKKRRERAKALQDEMELAHAQGDLVEKARVVQDLSTLFVNVKTHVRAWAKSLPPLLFGRSEKDISLAIMRETDRVLNELADGVKSVGKGGGNGKKK